MARYTFDGLASDYGQFKIPAVRVMLDDQDIAVDLGCRLQKVTVELSQMDASTAEIEVWDCYDMETHSLDPALKSGLSLGSRVQVEMGYKSSLAKVYDGYVETVTLDLSAGDAYKIHIRACDAVRLLKENTRHRIFKGTSHSSIFTEIMGSYSWICASAVDSTPELEAEGAWWQRGSDYDFITEELIGVHNPGYEFYVENGTAYFKKSEGKGDAVICLKPGAGVEAFQMSWSYLNRKIRVQGISESHERYLGEWPAVGGHVSDQAGQGIMFLAVPQADTQDKADGIASSVGHRLTADSVAATVTAIGLPQLVPGKSLELGGMDNWVNGVYEIIEAKHEMDEDGYRTTVTLGGQDACKA